MDTFKILEIAAFGIIFLMLFVVIGIVIYLFIKPGTQGPTGPTGPRGSSTGGSGSYFQAVGGQIDSQAANNVIRATTINIPDPSGNITGINGDYTLVAGTYLINVDITHGSKTIIRVFNATDNVVLFSVEGWGDYTLSNSYVGSRICSFSKSTIIQFKFDKYDQGTSFNPGGGISIIRL